MSLLKEVRERITAREVALACGIEVSRYGMACCPFHNDRHPSMKLDQRYHCFGCGADGDAISLTARLYGLSEKDAAKKLADDFGIATKKQRRVDQKTQKEIKKRLTQKTRYEETERNFYKALTDYYHLMKRWKTERAPHSPEEPWDEYFCEALQNMTEVEYIMDCFLAADLEEKINIMNDYGKKVKHFEERSEQYRSEEDGEV